MEGFFKQIYRGLIVSSQAEGNDPFNTPDGVTLFARAAEMGGASAIRSCGIVKTKHIIQHIALPVIGLTKSEFEDGYVKITRSANDVEKLFEIGCEMVAIDGTFRFWDGLSGPEFITNMKEKTGKLIMADISTLEDALACEKAGADCLSTTLNGYTPETENMNAGNANFELLKELVNKVKIPVIAEGRISSPADAKKAIELGAFAVVAGTVITRPRVVTSWYVNALKGL
ncbi:MAG: N-acetylmannosamine-6-phosphate 2-epimerase [Candidatus Marinimicrobia bacterium]|nr:N-acetylmannosamine-6-phosphate 2-epimerase [Candidatus Neomarinimicrobiota bacterium]